MKVQGLEKGISLPGSQLPTAPHTEKSRQNAPLSTWVPSHAGQRANLPANKLLL